MNPWMKDDAKRPQNVSEEEMELRWRLAFGKITQEQFDAEYEKIKDLPPQCGLYCNMGTSQGNSRLRRNK